MATDRLAGERSRRPERRRISISRGAASKPKASARPDAPPSPKKISTRLSRSTVLLHLTACTVLVALAIGLYARTLHAPLLWDDRMSVAVNPMVIQGPRPLTKFLQSNRPLTELTFALNYAQAGPAPRGYHLVNVVLHALNVLLVYAVADRTLRTPALAARFASTAPALAFAAAALFAAHPLQTETAAYVSSRSELLAAAFYLVAVLLYAVAATTARRRTRIVCMFGLPAAVVSALASKEMAATVPAGLLLYDWCFIAAGNWRRIRARARLLALVLLPFAIGVIFLLARDLGMRTAGFSFGRFNGWQYLLSQFSVILHYLRLTLVPVGLCVDTEWPLQRVPWSPDVLVPFVVLSALAASAIATIRRQPVFSFAVLWTFIVLAPTSSIIPIADLVAERRMYLALLGPALLTATGVWQLSPYVAASARARAVCAVLAIVVLLATLSVLTIARVRVWLDPVSLSEDAVAKSPDNPRARNNLASEYVHRLRLEDAQVQLEEAERLFRQHRSVHATDEGIGAYISLNLCDVLYRKGRLDDAAPRCQEALRLGGGYRRVRSMALMFLGHIAATRQQWPAAIQDYTESFRYADADIRLHLLLQLARAYIVTGQSDLARRTLDLAQHIDPGNAEVAAMLQQVH